MKHSFNLEQFKRATQAQSVRQILVNLGLSAKGGNYKMIYKYANKFGISLDHLKGQGWSKGTSRRKRVSTEDYLANKVPINSHRLKRRLLADGIFKHVCSCCNNTRWLDQPMPLELDHINGNSDDNSITNIRLLCPNCHSFTPNYRGKNKGNYVKHNTN